MINNIEFNGGDLTGEIFFCTHNQSKHSGCVCKVVWSVTPPPLNQSKDVSF